METFLDIAGRQIHTLRMKAGRTLDALGSGLSRTLTATTLRGYENGTQSIRVDTFVELCLALNMQPGLLLDKICGDAFTEEAVQCDVRQLTTAHGVLAPLRPWATEFLRDNPGHTVLRPDVVLLSRMASDCDTDIGTIVDELRKLSPDCPAENADEVGTLDITRQH
jgi:transcriptional regulator with XRE-family HTH domain